MSNDAQMTPMMAQYRRIKGELPPDALLLFRLGDFYEMFFEDAESGAGLLNVALTKRGTTPMCGIPFHAANNYISRLLRAGKKVAICEQVEEARPGQLVKREVTHILSPGTHFDERLLSADRNNYLAALCHFDGAFGLAFVDLTTGVFKTTALKEEEELMAELERLRPAELIHPSESARVIGILKSRPCLAIPCEDWAFAPETAQFTLRDHFKVASLDGFGLKNQTACIGSAGAILHYLSSSLRRDIKHLVQLSFYQTGDFLTLDVTSLRNLEVLEPLRRDSPRTACLYGALNRTATPMGARRLRDWLAQPLANKNDIVTRQNAIKRFVQNGPALEALHRELVEVRDLERTLGRLNFGSANARDLVALRTALQRIPAIKSTLQGLQNSPSQLPPLQEEIFPKPPVESEGDDLLARLSGEMTELPEVIDSIGRSIVDEPPLSVREGGLIRPGFDATLDDLRRATSEGKDWIAKLQQDEIEKTGISSLKVRFNSVFGYYIEVTKSNLDRVPGHYTRKQTIANGERFITPELKEMEGKILGAEERALKLEYEIFQRVRETVLVHMPAAQRTASAVAQTDVLAGLAETARLYNYCCPEIGSEGVLHIEEGRHPVLDQTVLEERFVPNDTHLDNEAQIALITGPNMAGKSTYIRQNALLALMAHTGSFIPARRARIDLLDRIFTRIGASDDLSRGQSTFMVEMTETANILNNSSRNSLIILDEVGRGTSTFDGLSLAWSIVEFIHNQIGAKTLFATHYHELTELAGRLIRVKNLNVAVREWNDQIVFLRKIVEGGADKSYGIQVARLAGVPKIVLERAKEILQNLEESELTPEGKPRASARRRAEREKLKSLSPPPQLDLFG